MKQKLSMRQKGKYTQLSREDAVAIVRGYHFGGKTQTALAEEYGVHSAYISKLVHGDARPDVYAEVAAEKAV